MHSVSEGQSCATTAENEIEQFVLIEKIFYRTVICGRATVCWKAQRLDNDGKELNGQSVYYKRLLAFYFTGIYRRRPP